MNLRAVLASRVRELQAARTRKHVRHQVRQHDGGWQVRAKYRLFIEECANAAVGQFQREFDSLEDARKYMHDHGRGDF